MGGPFGGEPLPPELPRAGTQPLGKRVPLEARARLPEAVGGEAVGQARGAGGRFLPKGTGIGAPGISHQEVVAHWLEQKYGVENVAHQVQIRPYTKSGRLGSAVRVDHVVRDPVTGQFSYFDSKTTGKASRHGQNLRYEQLGEFGGQVRSTKNLPQWLRQGENVPPGAVTKVHDTVEDIRRIKDGIRGTPARAAAPEVRGTINRGTSGARSTGQTPSPTAHLEELSPLPHRGGPGAGSKAARGAGHVPSLRPTLRSTAVKLGRELVKGLVWDLVALAVDLVLGYFEAQLAEENRRQMEARFRTKILPKVEPLLTAIWEQAALDPTLFPQRRRVYLAFPWRLVTHEEAQDAADAAVWALRFAVGRPGFVEVFHDVEVDTPLRAAYPLDRPYRQGEPYRRERVVGGESYYLYHYVSSILISDPQVTRLLTDLAEAHSDAETMWIAIVERIARLPSRPPGIDGRLASIGLSLRYDSFGAAGKDLWQLYEALWEHSGPGVDRVREAVHELAILSTDWHDRLVGGHAALGGEAQRLFSVFAPQFPPQALQLSPELETLQQLIGSSP